MSILTPTLTLNLPLRLDEAGRWRVGETRIPIETVIIAFQQGSSPQQIVADFDMLQLAHVYQIIGYYLEHQAEVDAYIAQFNAEGEAIMGELIDKHPDNFMTGETFLKKMAERIAKQTSDEILGG
jgi:uncharacterized protein (DUF433 family)